jgi:hypothetical protein
MDKISYVPKLNQIKRKLLYIKTIFIQTHRKCMCQICVILHNSYKINACGHLYNNQKCNPAEN